MIHLLHRIMIAAPLAFALAVAPAGATVRAEGFLAALDDVPVMPGLQEDAGAAVAFDTASGRIVTARISGKLRPGLDVGALLAFYAATLPALGWRAETPARFVRDGEILTLRAEAAGGRLALSFELRPN